MESTTIQLVQILGMRGTRKKILASQATKIYARDRKREGALLGPLRKKITRVITAGSGLPQCDRRETVSRCLEIKCSIESH